MCLHTCLWENGAKFSQAMWCEGVRNANSLQKQKCTNFKQILMQNKESWFACTTSLSTWKELHISYKPGAKKDRMNLASYRPISAAKKPCDPTHPHFPRACVATKLIPHKIIHVSIGAFMENHFACVLWTPELWMVYSKQSIIYTDMV